ncbi:hypothetical protein J7L05_03730 [bacterium]|nr:hypothetical protein [bacterium]
MSISKIRIFCFFCIILLLVGCSKGKQGQSPTSSEITLDDDITLIEESAVNRELQEYSDPPEETALRSFGEQGYTGNDYHMLVECVATTVYAEDGGCGAYNYTLVCDKNDKIDDTERVCCKIWKCGCGQNPSMPTHEISILTTASPPVTDPGACEIIAIRDELYAYIYDRASGYINEYIWDIDQDPCGDLTLSSDIQFYDYGDFEDVVDMCVVTTNRYDTTWHLLVLDNGSSPVIKVYNQSRTYLSSLNITDFEDVTTYKPVALCAAKWNDGTPWWFVYVAAKHPTDASYDRVLCYRWDGSDYSTNARLAIKHSGEGDDYFDNIIGLDVAKVGLESDRGDPKDSHKEGTVCVYMADENFRGWRARQVQFTHLFEPPGRQYYEFIQDFDETEMADGEIWVEDFSMGFRSWPDDQIGFLYFTADRNPDIVSGHDNIRMYTNDDT